ncbi:immunoglobulin A1 protease autotransporter [Drosophila mojavensis]|uniref:Uncharacterized protein n=1 Tax=Drosophila mojavensis TaxID=7230 RepID=B4KYS4_DROMO|nr:immunoglobulin A1 protease autotransporter [Drosophila mojavensis]EDW17788.2 uncharacterized protein Dmoj_GI12453 [Drosophila mojavensis]
MGCASSTPMVATAGSEMLKAATHVAGDVQKQGEAAVADATQAISSTMDTAKETVSTAVAGITNELGSAFKEGSEALEEAKHKVMEGLHLESKTNAENTETSSSRAPTPALEPDGDSLKTSTPEPEIERALANEEEAPPTPKPSLEELAGLSAQASEASVVTVVAATVVAETTGNAETKATVDTDNTLPCNSHWQRKGESEQEEQRRPNTTEWEKLADLLAKGHRFRPYESFARNQNQFSVYKDYTSLRDKPGHYDGHFSDGTSLSSTQSDLSSGHLTPAPPKGQRDYAKFVGAEQPTSVSRASSRLSNVGGAGTTPRAFDYNPQRERINLGTRGASRVESARRSLWARSQPDVLPEEPSYNPVRRSSLVAALRPVVDAPQRPMSRSTSNLQMTRKQREEQRDAMPGSRRHSEVNAVRPKQKENKAAPQKPARSKPAKETKPLAKPPTESRPQLGATYKSALDSSRDISSALLLTTPLTATSLLHSPKADSGSKPPTPTVARAGTFVVEPKQTPAVTHATPLRQATRTSAALIADAIESEEERARILPESSTAMTQQTLASPERTSPNAASAVTKSLPSPSASRAPSRISSSSSDTDVVIQPLSHLNTPSAVSLSPDVVVTEYDDSDLEAALAQLAGRRGSAAASLHSQRSATRNSNTSTVRDSRRTSPWLRRNMDNYGSQELKTHTSCGALGVCSSAQGQGAGHLLERCEICCNEFVMS